MSSTQTILTRRDRKVRPHLEQYAPVWLVDEKVMLDDEAVQFNIVFQHNIYGWVSRRYRYDGFNDVLYFKGERSMTEDQALRLQEEQPPYITATVADIPNAYGG